MATTAGIDLGSEAIKGIVLSKTGSGPVEMLAAGTMPIGDLGHMDDSPDKTLALGIKLKELVKTARLKGKARRLGASGKNTSIRYLQVPPVPPWRLEMLVNYEVQEKANDKETQTYDYHILDVPEVGGQYTVMIGMLKESSAADLLAVGRASGLGEVEIDLEALALYNAYYHGHGFDADKTVLVVDIGADDITILLCHHGGLYFARTVMGGGRRFTQVLAEELKIETAEAEELKKNIAEISFDLTPIAGRTARIPRAPGSTGIMSRPPGGTVMMSRGPGATAKTDVTASAGGITSLPAAKSTLISGAASAANTAAPLVGSSAPGAVAPVPAVRPEITITDLPEMPPSLEALDEKAAEPQTVLLSMGELELQAPAIAPQKPVPSSPPVESADEKRKRQMTGALIREAAALCAALENAVLFCKQQTKTREIKVDRIYLTGGGSKLKGLGEFMGRRMRVEVMPLEPLRQVSLNRLPAEHQLALKGEQHTMAVATGLALGEMQRGAFSFLLLPETVMQRKRFWSRGAYLYYAAALIILSLAMFLFAPYRNEDALQDNFKKAEAAVADAQTKSQDIKRITDEHEEDKNRYKQIAENVLSGHYFLNLLAELKSTTRINDELWLTQISTSMPQVIRNLGEGPMAERTPTPGTRIKPVDDGPDTFQTQRRVYLRGFVRGEKDGEQRIVKIREFLKRMLPFPDEPDNPANLFKDVRPIWFSTEDYKQGTRKTFVQDASLPRLKGAKETQIWIFDKDTGTAVHKMVSVGQMQEGWVEIAGPGVDRLDGMLIGDIKDLTDGQKMRVDGDDIKTEGRDVKVKMQKFKIVENSWYLTEFVLEAYTEGTREVVLKKPEKPGARGAPQVPQVPTQGPAQIPVPAGNVPEVAPAPRLIPPVLPTAAPANKIPQPNGAPPVPVVPVPAGALKPVVLPGAEAAPAVPEVPKKKKFINVPQPNAAPAAPGAPAAPAAAAPVAPAAGK